MKQASTAVNKELLVPDKTNASQGALDTLIQDTSEQTAAGMLVRDIPGSNIKLGFNLHMKPELSG